MQEQLDRIATRVSSACLVGAAAGGVTALYRGRLVGRTALLSSLSCGMVATACFSAECLASALLTSDDGRPTVRTTATHAIGGALGGALVGALYGNKPIQGALFLTPILAAIGLGQELYDSVHEEQVHRKRAPKET